MVKQFENLADIVQYAKSKHPALSKEGVCAYKLLKAQGNRSRLAIEIMNGFKIHDFAISEQPFIGTILRIHQLPPGFSNMFMNLYLYNMAMVNVYDHGAEFFTYDNIDLAYVGLDQPSVIQALAEWTIGDQRRLRGQWVGQQKEASQVLKTIWPTEQRNKRRLINTKAL